MKHNLDFQASIELNNFTSFDFVDGNFIIFHVTQNPILLFTKSSNKILEVSFGRGELKNGENLKGGREMKKHMTQASALLIFIFVWVGPFRFYSSVN